MHNENTCCNITSIETSREVWCITVVREEVRSCIVASAYSTEPDAAGDRRPKITEAMWHQPRLRSKVEDEHNDFNRLLQQREIESTELQKVDN
mmetsp:Transcript_3581/g.5280  ORF Transcript_3581/g.5280 Transcript_3581/m.5280 type:complete len:93 (-) Transcript_3581:297-575(-)